MTRFVFPVFASFLLVAVGAFGAPDATRAVDGPAFAPSWDPAAWLEGETRIAIEIRDRSAVRLAVFIGPTDVTDLFRRVGNRLEYRSELLTLPSGESEVVIWTVKATDWQERGRFPLKIRGRGGFEVSELTANLDLEALADIDRGGDELGAREHQLTGQFDLRHRGVRGGWSLSVGANVLGASRVEQALRFGIDGEDAELVDLSSWDLALTRGRFELGLGHLAWGDSRLLIQAFSSRGGRLQIPLGGAVGLSLVAMNGSSIVGWDNPLGLNRSEHQIAAATVGIEAVPGRPGALRFEITGLDGSLSPENGFNQGGISDREDSRGLGVRVVAAPNSRLRLDASWARSNFTNPADALLAQGDELVPVDPATTTARALDLTWAMLQRQSSDGRSLEVALDLKHSQADPLYRSVGAAVAADVEESGGQLRLTWGSASALLSHHRSRDNLDDVASILTTRTRRTTWAFQLPLAELTSSTSGWLPVFALSGERTHQAGADLPIGGGFSPSHVPDQVSLSHQASLGWTGARWTLALTGSSSDQDNRQPGREAADFEHRSYGISVFTSLAPSLDLGLDLRRERQSNLEIAEVTSTDVANLVWTWRVARRQVVNGTFSWTSSETAPGQRSSTDLLGDAQWSWNLERKRREHSATVRFYVGASYREARSDDEVFALFTQRDGWKVTAGLSSSLH